MEMRMTAAEQIKQIDRNIDGIRLELYRRGARNLFSAHDWQLAWDRNPDLAARDKALFRQRGALQVIRNSDLERAYRAEQRQARRNRRAA